MKKPRIVFFIIFILSILLISACGGGDQGAPAATALVGDAAAGKAGFDQFCSVCHGTDGKGRAGLGKNLITSEFVKSKTDAELVAFIAAGRPSSDPANTTGVDMPAKGGNPSFTDQDLANIVAYVRTLQ